MFVTIVRRTSLVALAFAMVGCDGPTGAGTHPGSLATTSAIAGMPLAKFRPDKLCSNQQPDSIPESKANKYLFVSETQSNTVNIYGLKERKLVKSITNGISYPLGTAIDKGGVLYVVNQPSGSTDTVTEYAPGSSTPELTLDTGVTAAIGVGVDSSGTVYVDNDYPAEMLEFAAGSKTPTKTFDLSLAAPWGLAIDTNNDVYVVDLGGAIWEFSAGSTTGQNLGLLSLGEPNGLAVDAKGNLYVSAYAGTQGEVLVYPHGAASPVCTITQGISNPALLAVSAHGTTYVTNGTPPGTVTSYLPGETAPRWMMSGISDPFGIALGPKK
jgi:DNA-binding beta-propeller fold protein YncE